MDEGSASETIPDLKDIEVKIGRKTPEGLLKWMREEASSHRADAKLVSTNETIESDAGKKSLDEKIRKLKLEMAQLRSVDVKILQQLLAVHEGIEAVKWLLEERSTLTSHCSSLTSSQYSLGEGPDTSWRGSWSSLQDPNDKLDNISVGSYLDTLADDMDEYCASSSESVICTSTAPASEAAGGGRGAPPAGAQAGHIGAGGQARATAEAGVGSAIAGNAGSSAQTQSEGPKQDACAWTKATETDRKAPVSKDNAQVQTAKTNGVSEKSIKQTGGRDVNRACLKGKLDKNQSPKLKPYKNGKIDLETCKMNGKVHLEYDAHWRWVQSQEDVTFL